MLSPKTHIKRRNGLLAKRLRKQSVPTAQPLVQRAPLYTRTFRSTLYNAVITMGLARVVSKSRFKSIDSNVA